MTAKMFCVERRPAFSTLKGWIWTLPLTIKGVASGAQGSRKVVAKSVVIATVSARIVVSIHVIKQFFHVTCVPMSSFGILLTRTTMWWEFYKANDAGLEFYKNQYANHDTHSDAPIYA